MIQIINQINELAPFLDETDLDWIVPKLLSHYDVRIRSLARKAYGAAANQTESGPSVALSAFREWAREEISSALKTFLFKSEHWRSGRNIEPYLIKSIGRLADRLKWNQEGDKKINALVCPGCKYLLKKEYLQPFGKLWKCPACYEQTQIIDGEIAKSNESMSIKLEMKSKLFKAFAFHSKTGYRCPECSRFIPESSNGVYGIVCPYPDCSYFGDVRNLEKMIHPVSLTRRNNLSLQTPIDEKHQIQELIVSHNIEAECRIQASETFIEELNLLKQVVDNQLDLVNRTNCIGTKLQKALMYEAYRNIINKFPEEMVSYLVHRKQSADFPLQAKIFQEYVGLMQDSLPYTIIQNNKEYEVMSLLDPKISLFDGISVFDANVRFDYTIPNNTAECYMGGRKFKNYGPCFIGLILDIEDKNKNISIKEEIKEYSFVQIKMKNTVEAGTPVTVKHYRMPSHYEMGSLVYLQRTRKKIVDKIYFKMNGKQRITKSEELFGDLA